MGKKKRILKGSSLLNEQQLIENKISLHDYSNDPHTIQLKLDLFPLPSATVPFDKQSLYKEHYSDYSDGMKQVIDGTSIQIRKNNGFVIFSIFFFSIWQNIYFFHIFSSFHHLSVFFPVIFFVLLWIFSTSLLFCRSDLRFFLHQNMFFPFDTVFSLWLDPIVSDTVICIHFDTVIFVSSLNVLTSIKKSSESYR